MLTWPSLDVDPSGLGNLKPGEADGAAINQAVEALLAEQTKTIASLGSPELARLQQRWERLLPRLLSAAGVDANRFRAAAKEYGAQLGKAASLPAKDRRASLASELKQLPSDLEKISAVMMAARTPAPGSSLVLMGPPCILGAIDASFLAELELWFEAQHPSPQCLDQTFGPPYPAFSSSGLDTSPDWGDVLDPTTGHFAVLVMSLFVGWPHKSCSLGSVFTVRDTDTHVTVTAELTSGPDGNSAQAGGLGYAHAWSQLQLAVYNVEFRATSDIVEPFNINSELGPVEYAIPPGEVQTFTLTCSFDRAPGSPVTFLASLQASVDTTTIALGGASSFLGLSLERIAVHSCS